MPGLLHRHRRLILCVALAVVTFVVYAPARDHEFVHLDDDLYVTQNPHVRSGLSGSNARWAFTDASVGYWHPLTWLSHQTDCQLFGLDAGPHHVVSVLLHVVNAVLVLLLLSLATKRLGPSAFVAALFALHPLHVESVAWIAERKDVLSTLFALLALIAYVRYAERPSWGRYLGVLVPFALGLMSKPMLVTLPVLMLLLDVWPLHRLGARLSLGRAVIEKVPLFAVSAAIGVLTLVASKEGGAMGTLDSIPWASRIDNATASYLAYLGQMFWPSRLAAVYPFPTGDVQVLRVVIQTAALLLLTAVFVHFGRRRGYLVVGWLWYLVTLLPVIGIVQIGPHAMADRYTYVSLIGPFVIVAFGAADLAASLRLPRFALAPVAVGVLVACALAASAQLTHWKDSAALFGHAIEVTEGNTFMLMKQATLLHDQGRSAESLPYFEEALRLRPDVADIHMNHANALRAVGRSQEALAEYEVALSLDPGSALAHYNLAVALDASGEPAKAIEHYESAIRRNPGLAPAYTNLGLDLLKVGRPEQAAEVLERALRLDPEDAFARRGLREARDRLDVLRPPR